MRAVNDRPYIGHYFDSPPVLRTLHHISHLRIPRKCQLLLQEKPFAAGPRPRPTALPSVRARCRGRGAPRSESLIYMIAGGNHTIIHDHIGPIPSLRGRVFLC